MNQSQHILKELTFPDRYETLVEILHHDVARLLVSPPSASVRTLEAVAQEVRSRGEGVLLPIWGQSGSGKTTFVMNASHWAPRDFTQTLIYEGEISFDSLKKALSEFIKLLPANNGRIIPVNIDHRENDPPSSKELSAIKRFLRTNGTNVPSVIFWPETNIDTATEISKQYIEICGEISVDLPLRYEGPQLSTWQDIASATLLYANKIENLESLGIDPKDYNPSEHFTLGRFMRKIQHDFNVKIQQYRTEIEKPLSLIIVFASESNDPGILTQLTNPARYTLLDGHALISVTSQSLLGKWWAERRGLLTRAIVQLNARAVALGPSATMSCLRAFDNGDGVEFDKIGYPKRKLFNVLRTFLTTDLGKILCNKQLDRFEARGKTAEKAEQAFKVLADKGFNYGSDKGLNRVMSGAIEKLLEQERVNFLYVKPESKLDFCGIHPDILIDYGEHCICVEITWRKGNFLDFQSRSTVAQYILGKLQTYVRQLGWTND
jgi:hypothetical protein